MKTTTAEATASADTTQKRHTELYARYWVIEAELEAAPYHRIGTFWWDERVKEMRTINHRLGR